MVQKWTAGDVWAACQAKSSGAGAPFGVIHKPLAAGMSDLRLPALTGDAGAGYRTRRNRLIKNGLLRLSRYH